MAGPRAMFVLLAALVGAGTASAADSGPPADSRSTAIGMNVGANSTVGLVGLTLMRALGRYLRIEVGGGVGFWGTQVSLMSKVVLGTGPLRYVGGVGVARVFPPSRDHCCEVDGSPTWLIVDALAYEHRFDNGLALGFALGPTLGLGGGRICDYFDGCSESDLHDVAGRWKGQLRFELAYWF